MNIINFKGGEGGGLVVTPKTPPGYRPEKNALADSEYIQNCWCLNLNENRMVTILIGILIQVMNVS